MKKQREIPVWDSSGDQLTERDEPIRKKQTANSRKTIGILLGVTAVIALCTVLGPQLLRKLHISHEFGAWDVLKEATCEENGYKECKCDCGETVRKKIDSTSNTEVVDPGESTDYITTGKTEGRQHIVMTIILSGVRDTERRM